MVKYFQLRVNSHKTLRRVPVNLNMNSTIISSDQPAFLDLFLEVPFLSSLDFQVFLSASPPTDFHILN